ESAKDHGIPALDSGRGGGRPARLELPFQAKIADASVRSPQLTLARICTAANRPQCIYLMTSGFFEFRHFDLSWRPLQSLDINVRHWCVTVPVCREEVRYITRHVRHRCFCKPERLRQERFWKDHAASGDVTKHEAP